MFEIIVPGLYLLSGICAYAAANHLSVGLKQPFDPIQVMFAGLCLLVIFLSFSSVLMMQAMDVEQFIAALKWNLSIVFLFFTLFIWFIAQYTKKRPLPILLGLSILFAVLMVANIIEPYSVQYDVINGIRSLHMPWGESVTRAVGHNSGWTHVAIAGALLTFGYALYELGSCYRRDHGRTCLHLMLAVGLLLLSAIEGILVRLSVIDFIEAGPFGYLGMIIVMSVVLTREPQQRLRNSENRFRSLVENTPDTVTRYDEKCRRIYANPRMQADANVPLDELLNKTPEEFPGGEMASAYQARIRQVLEKGEPVDFDLDWCSGDGKAHSSYIRLTPEFAANGKVATVLGVGRDVTERKANLQELHRWHDIFEHADWGVVIGSADGNTLELMNPAFASMHGYTVEELTGRSIAEVFAPQSREDLPEQIRLAHEKGHHSFESLHLRKDGTIFPVYIDVTVVRGMDGEVLHRIVNVQDITERRQAEETVRQLNANLSATLRAIPDLMFEHDGDGTYINVYAKNPTLLAAPKDALIGRTLAEMLPPEAAEVSMAALREADEEEYSYGKVICLDLAEGPRWFELSVAKKNDSHGAEARFISMSRDITDRKVAEDALRESEGKYRTLIQKIQAGVVVHSADTRIISCNEVAQKILGLTEDQLLGKTTIDPAWYFSREDGSRMPQDEYPVNIVLASCKPLRNYELQIHRPTRENDVWALVNADPVFDIHSELTQVIVTFIDITERKEAERLLHERDQAIRAVVENSPDTITRYDKQCRRIFVNPAMQKLCDLPSEKLLAKTPLESSPVPDAQVYAQAIRKVFESGQEFHMELPFRRADGEMGWGDLRLAPEFGTDGAVVSVLVIGRDMTERKRAEEALTTSEREFRTLAENLPDYIVRYDREGRTVYLNPSLERFLGTSARDRIGKTVREWYRDGSLERYARTVDAVLASGEEAEIEMIRPGLDGQVRAVYQQIRMVAERDEQGEIDGVLAIGRDITALKEAEEHLEETQAELRELATRIEATREEERRHIARELHDELGQLLTAIRMGVSHLKLEYEPDDARFQERMQRIVGLVDNTIKHVREVVTMLRPAVLERGIVAALEWLTDEFKARTGIACELRIDQEKIDLDEEYAIAIFRIVQESLTNVTRHADADWVVIELECKNGNYRLKVGDNGRGFDPAQQKKKSLGLVGLRERVLRLGGEVKIDSALDQGTTVEVIIPLKNEMGG